MTPLIFVPGQEAGLPNYSRALGRAGGLPRFSSDPAKAADCHGLLLPGGGDLDPGLYGQESRGARPPDRQRDLLELALLRRFLAAGKPVLGICRGLQVINVFFGGTLLQDIPGHSQLRGRDRLHLVEAAPGSLPARLWGPVFPVNSAHHQAADRLGDGLRATAWGPEGIAEALCHRVLPVWAFQWHPERMGAACPGTPDGDAVFRFFLRKCRENLEENS